MPPRLPPEIWMLIMEMADKMEKQEAADRQEHQRRMASTLRVISEGNALHWYYRHEPCF